MRGCSEGVVAPLGGGACVVAPGGHAWLLGGMHGCSGGGMHGIRRDMEIGSMSRRYASYWNAFCCIVQQMKHSETRKCQDHRTRMNDLCVTHVNIKSMGKDIAVVQCTISVGKRKHKYKIINYSVVKVSPGGSWAQARTVGINMSPHAWAQVLVPTVFFYPISFQCNKLK